MKSADDNLVGVYTPNEDDMKGALVAKSAGLKSGDGCSNHAPATKPFRLFEIRWAEPLGRRECPYVKRWVLTVFGWSLRLHHWTGSDDQRFFHDHAWDFVSLILRGGYYEITPPPDDEDGDRVRWCAVGSLRFYKAEHQHKVSLRRNRPCWSLVLSMPRRRNFGFWVNNHLMRPLRYFSRYGLHPCD